MLLSGKGPSRGPMPSCPQKRLDHGSADEMIAGRQNGQERPNGGADRLRQGEHGRAEPWVAEGCLAKAGCQETFEDQVSGEKAERPGLVEATRRARTPGAAAAAARAEWQEGVGNPQVASSTIPA